MIDAEKIGAALSEYSHRLTNYNFISYGGAGKVVCPLCKEEHVGCQFASGSLWCARPGCANPHHRTNQ